MDRENLTAVLPAVLTLLQYLLLNFSNSSFLRCGEWYEFYFLRSLVNLLLSYCPVQYIQIFSLISL